MMIRLLALLLLSTWLGGARADAPEGYPFLPFDQAMGQAAAEDKPVFVYFGRYGCGYCEKTNREAFSDPKVRERYTQGYVLTYVDSEGGRRLRLPSGGPTTEGEFGTRYKAFVSSVFSLLRPDGEAVLRLIGVQRAEDLLRADQEAQARMGAKDRT